MNVGIIAACLIALPPLIKKYPVRSFSSIGSWSLRVLRSPFLRKSDKSPRSSNTNSAADHGFRGISVHLPAQGGFTELRDVGKGTERFKEEGYAVVEGNAGRDVGFSAV